MERTVFFVSDRTGITAETLGHSLLTQFDDIQFRQIIVPFVDCMEKADDVVDQIDRVARESGTRPVVFSTLIDSRLRERVAACAGLFLDFFDTFIGPLEREFEVRSSHTVGRSHGLSDTNTYSSRMDAVNFALSTDDGTTTQDYDKADVILVGVSRSGKTPTCLYLALQFGVRASNYPLTEEDLDDSRLPAPLVPFRDKLFGLTINAERLQQIRHERRPNSRYSSMRQCRHEVGQTEALLRRKGVPFVDTTNMSIEEIAATILHQTKLRRRLY
jgi:[pyruvate, water dikinase]-phosphate phosphotransferase / [pyruvate, water dikinase] kinase